VGLAEWWSGWPVGRGPGRAVAQKTCSAGAWWSGGLAGLQGGGPEKRGSSWLAEWRLGGPEGPGPAEWRSGRPAEWWLCGPLGWGLDGQWPAVLLVNCGMEKLSMS
jgi:hypothetical protein